MDDTSRYLAGGHRWMRCDRCAQLALALEPGGACRQRAAIAKTRQRDDGTIAVRWSCGGRLRLVDAPAPRGGVACARGGCGNAGVFTTAIGELVCSRCLYELAAIGEGNGKGNG